MNYQLEYTGNHHSYRISVYNVGSLQESLLMGKNWGNSQEGLSAEKKSQDFSLTIALNIASIIDSRS